MCVNAWLHLNVKLYVCEGMDAMRGVRSAVTLLQARTGMQAVLKNQQNRRFGFSLFFKARSNQMRAIATRDQKIMWNALYVACADLASFCACFSI